MGGDTSVLVLASTDVPEAPGGEASALAASQAVWCSLAPGRCGGSRQGPQDHVHSWS